MSFIRIKGAKVHNLRNVDLDIPRYSITVLTGVSGSGKTSLALDLLHAESQRQFIESLSVGSRRFLHQLERPDVDRIIGLQPTIAIEQEYGPHHPRSTVATVTEIHDHLRVLYARFGMVHCYKCHREIKRQTTDGVADELCGLPENTRIMLLAPVHRDPGAEIRDSLRGIAKAGFVRVRFGGHLYDIEELLKSGVPPMPDDREHDIEAIIDRLVLRDGVRIRLEESLKLTEKQGAGTIIVAVEKERQTRPDGSSTSIWKDMLFSTHHSCPKCKIDYPEMSPRFFSFNSLSGACPNCTGLGAIEDSNEICPACNGARLRPEALAVSFEGKRIDELCRLTIEDARGFFAKSVQVRSDGSEKIIGKISGLLDYLVRSGLDYLSLDRPAGTLSSGELQRLRLAAGLGGGLSGVCYVLDEPSKGLHPRDTMRLFESLRELRELGNTLLVIEHDEFLMRKADLLVDFGPGAGKNGGRIVAYGTPESLQSHPDSLTGQHLAGILSIPVPEKRRLAKKGESLLIEGVTTHNLKNVTVDFPLGLMICVSGVSGSGKSSLINETLVPAIESKLSSGTATGKPSGEKTYRSLHGTGKIDKLIRIDSSPIGRSSRSNPATYTGLFDAIREIFASTKDAKRLGFKANRFSFNSTGGRCDVCKGYGTKKIEMHFLPDIFVRCEECGGKRFNRQTLEIRYKERSIAEVLEMNIGEASVFFANFPEMQRVLKSLNRLGLDYLGLGQSSLTLSGGEAQRVRLATELARPDTGKTLYVLDEPTSGLHVHDVARLLDVLNELIELGNTVIIIEHHLDVIKSADWIIDIGPGSGVRGGEITAIGTPEKIAAVPDNETGRFLKQIMEIS